MKNPDSYNNNLIVLVNYTTQPGKQSEALDHLSRLIEKVKTEKHFVSIRLHTNQSDPTRILLYEEWSSADYYKTTHMQTEHLQQFITDSRGFLAAPPDIEFWEVMGR